MASEKSRSAIILNRLRDFLKISTDTEMAEFLGIAQSTYSGWKGRDSADMLKIIEICDNKGIDVDWDVIINGEQLLEGMSGMRPFSSEMRSSASQIPLFLVPAPAGAATPADDYVEEMLNVQGLPLSNGKRHFACKIIGDSMEGIGIQSGDIVIAEERVGVPNDVVICSVNGKLKIRRLVRSGEREFLYPENSRYEPEEITENTEIEIWGVAINVIRSLS